VIEVGLFILPSVKELVSAEVPEISTMYWTPAKSGLEIFCCRGGAFGLEMNAERSRVIHFSVKRAWRLWRERRFFSGCARNEPRYGDVLTGVPLAVGFTDVRRLTTGIRTEKYVVR